MNIFQMIGNFFHTAEQDVVHEFQKLDTPASKAKIQTVLNDIGMALPIATKIAAEIDAIIPNRTVEELETLATQFGAVFSTDMMADTLKVGQFLEGIALKQIQAKFPNLSAAALNAAINTAVAILHA